MPTPKSFALWRIFQRSISERSSQWFIDFLFITRDSRKSNKLCGRKTMKQNGFTLWIRFLLLSFCLVSCSWTRTHRTDVHFLICPHDSFRVLCVISVQCFSPGRSSSYPVIHNLHQEHRSILQERVLSYRCLLLCRRHSASARLRVGIQWWLLFQLGIG